MIRFVALDLEATVLLTGSSKTSVLPVFVNSVADPVNTGVLANSFVVGVNQDDFIKFVGSILVDPVRVQNTKVSASASNTLLGEGLQVAPPLYANNSMSGGLATSATSRNRVLAATTPNTDAIYNEPLLGLVSQTTGLVRPARSAGAVNGGQLTVFPSTNT